MMASGNKVSHQVKDSSNGLLEKSTRVKFSMARSTAEESKSGQMARNTMEILKRTRSRGTAECSSKWVARSSRLIRFLDTQVKKSWRKIPAIT